MATTAAERHMVDAHGQQFKHAFLFLNPESGRQAQGYRLEEILAALAKRQIKPDVCVGHPHEAEKLVRDAVKRGAELVIAAGGDGTVEWVARGVIGSEATLGILPVGTENNVAGNLGLPTDLHHAVQTIAEGETRAIDVGVINGFHFLEVAGVGLAAELMPIGNQMRARDASALPAALHGIARLWTYRPVRLKLRLDGQHAIRTQTLQVDVCNLPRYGLHFDVAPEARLTDGRLDVVYLETTSKWALGRFLLASRRGGASHAPALRVHQTERITIKCKRHLPVYADKVAVGHTPVTVKVAAGALRVRLPTHHDSVTAPDVLDGITAREETAQAARHTPGRAAALRAAAPAVLVGLAAGWLLRERDRPKRRRLADRLHAIRKLSGR